MIPALFTALTKRSVPRAALLIVLGGGVLLAALWVGVLADLRRERETLVAATQDRAQILSKALAHHARATVHDMDVLARMVKREFEQAPGKFDLSALQKAGLVTQLSAAQVSIVDDTGKIVQSSIQYAGGVHVDDRKHFQIHRQPEVRGLYIGEPVIGRVSGLWTIQFTRRLEYPDGRFAGVVVVSEDRRHLLHQFLDAAGLATVDRVALRLHDGTLLSANLPAATDDTAFPVEAAETPLHTVPVPNREVPPTTGDFVARQDVTGYPIVAEIKLDAAHALQPYRQMERTYLLLTSLMTLFIIGFVGAICALLLRLTRSETRLRNLSETDSLTGLLNRHGLLDQLKKTLHTDPPPEHLALVYVDLGNLKHVNDSLGHEAGDQLLRIIGQRLQHALPAQAWSRFGGDEFVAFIGPAPDAATLSASLNTTREALFNVFAKPVPLRGHVFQIPAAIGAALHSHNQQGIHILIRKADEAMYHAKTRSRATGDTQWHLHSNAMREARQQWIEIEQRARSGADIPLWHTPLTRWTDGVLWGMRLHPSRPALTPLNGAALHAMPITPESGLPRLLLENGLRQLSATQNRINSDTPHAARLCCHLDGNQILDDGCMATLHGWLNQHAEAARQLWIEIPESVILTDEERSLTQIRYLHQKGVPLIMGAFSGNFHALTLLDQKLFGAVSINMPLSETARIVLDQLLARGITILEEENHARESS